MHDGFLIEEVPHETAAHRWRPVPNLQIARLCEFQSKPAPSLAVWWVVPQLKATVIYCDGRVMARIAHMNMLGMVFFTCLKVNGHQNSVKHADGWHGVSLLI